MRSKPLGHRRQTFSTASTITDVPTGAEFVLIQPDSNVRFKDDGDSPSSTAGILLGANSHFYYDGDLSALELASEGASAVVNFAFYGGTIA